MPKNITTPKAFSGLSFDEFLRTMPTFVQEYVASMIGSHQRSVKTCHSYLYDFRLFFRYLLEKEIVSKNDIKEIIPSDLGRLQVIDIEGFFTWLRAGYVGFDDEKTHNKEPGIARKKASLKSLFLYLCEERELIDKNIMHKFGLRSHRSNIGKKPVVYLKENEVLQFMDSVVEGAGLGSERAKLYAEKTRSRDIAIIVMLLHTGIRVSTLVALNRGDVDFVNAQMRVVSKGNKTAILPIAQEALYALKQYLEAPDRPKPTTKTDRDAIFLSLQAQRISISTVQKLVKKFSRAAGLPHISVHKLRHTFGTTTYKHLGDIKMVSELLQHENISTTAAFYVGTNMEEKQRAVNKLPSLLKKE